MHAALDAVLPFHGEVLNYRKDGAPFWNDLSITPLLDVTGKLTQFVGVLRDVTERKVSEQERSESAQRLTLLSQHLVAVQEEARRRLAGELHDRTSPNLAAVGINLEVAAMALQAHDWAEVSERMADNRALIEDTAASIRDICADLRPPALDHAGLLPALEAYASHYFRRTGIAITLDCVGRDTKLSRDKESILFRIFQEALTNIAKHAEASSISVELSLDDQLLRMSVSDDGNGFDPEAAAESSGLGLINMREMAEFSGGTFALLASPGQGVRIQVEIPTSELLA